MSRLGTTPYLAWTTLCSPPDYDVEDWNAAVRKHFGPFVRRKSILHRERELLRTELINLARLLPYQEDVRLLKGLVRLYRRGYHRASRESLQFLGGSLSEVVRASENWIALFSSLADSAPASAQHDQVHQRFNELETILEGCLKPYLRLAHGFSAYDRIGTFPIDVHERDFGALLTHVREALGTPADLLRADPIYGIPVNQWRNIAAHRSFRLVDNHTISVAWGRKKVEHREVLFSDLEQVLTWAIRALGVTRLASVIIFLEYMPELDGFHTHNLTLRLESWMVTLSHNLGVVGFEVVGWHEEDGVFYVSMRNRLERPSTAALIHASQVLDQLAMAVESDPARRDGVKHVAVRLVDVNGELVASAQLSTEDALAATRGELSTQDRIERTQFSFVDVRAAQEELRGLRM